MAYLECTELGCDYAVGDPRPGKVEERMAFHTGDKHCPCGGFGGDDCPLIERVGRERGCAHE
jgi:hypothetical protein